MSLLNEEFGLSERAPTTGMVAADEPCGTLPELWRTEPEPLHSHANFGLLDSTVPRQVTRIAASRTVAPASLCVPVLRALSLYAANSSAHLS